jgi:transaldolase
MRKAGISDYEAFAKDLLTIVTDRPVSFEVFSDDFDEMYDQALYIAGWGENVYVKLPVTNTRGESSARLIRALSSRGVKVNATAILTLEQVETVADALADGAPAVISVFAGRIADTGRDPVPVMQTALSIVRKHHGIELLWASCREVLNIIQADQIGCDIITVPHDLLAKIPMFGQDLDALSLDTVCMFRRDATAAGFTLPLVRVAAASAQGVS